MNKTYIRRPLHQMVTGYGNTQYRTKNKRTQQIKHINDRPDARYLCADVHATTNTLFEKIFYKQCKKYGTNIYAEVPGRLESTRYRWKKGRGWTDEQHKVIAGCRWK